MRKSKPSPFKQFYRKVSRSDPVHRVTSAVVALYAKLVVRTSRWTEVDYDNLTEHLTSGRKAFVLLWHNRVFLMPFGWSYTDHHLSVLISEHNDGRLTQRVIEAAGVNYLRVPTTHRRSGSSAEHTQRRASTIREIKRLSDRGDTLSVVGDGPRGPRFVLKPNAIELARLCDADIFLTTYTVKRRIVVASWDRLIIPLPFNRGVFRVSKQSYDPRRLNADGREELRQRIEADLIAFNDETDAMLGHQPIKPAAPSETAGRGKAKGRR